MQKNFIDDLLINYDIDEAILYLTRFILSAGSPGYEKLLQFRPVTHMVDSFVSAWQRYLQKCNKLKSSLLNKEHKYYLLIVFLDKDGMYL